MKYSTVALALLCLSNAIAQPHKRHQHRHQRNCEKCDVVSAWGIVTETLSISTTICVDVTYVPSTITTSQVSTTLSSTIQSAARFYQPPTPTASTPYTSPAPSTSSVYILPATPTTTSQAPSVAPNPTTAAPAAANTTQASFDGACSFGSPCEGDITYYTAGLGACGIINNGTKEMVIALPHELMGTESNNNPYCGKTVTIEHEGISIVAIVEDKCMGCTGYSIDLSMLAFSSLGIPLAVGRTTATWYFND